MVYYGAGWLEGRLIESYKKFIIDCEMIQQLQRYLDPGITGKGEEQLAISAILEIGDNGHFFEQFKAPPISSKIQKARLFRSRERTRRRYHH